ncbi:hypothetical protein [Clostridium sp.]|uniref:hypothetical protein n=1 Tax=Clostridium sp. TaxID=1506 RepID=UPI002841F3C8|nr:hypothetical protein [Clostridium sp.]MDR3594144.1 hypothetical protein [Clostridium sp.]
MRKDYMKYSENLCEELNENVEGKRVIFRVSDSGETIEVRKVLDIRGMAFNAGYFTDEDINENSLDEMVELVLDDLGMGKYKTVFPTPKEIELCDKLKINCWLEEGIRIEQGVFYIKEEAWSSIDTMEFIKINRDTIEIITKDDIEEEGFKMTIKRGLEVNIEDGKMIPFNVVFGKEEEEKFVRYVIVDEIDFKTATGKIYSSNGELRYNDKLGDNVICDLDKLTKITYVANENVYIVGTVFEESQIEYEPFNKFGLEM